MGRWSAVDSIIDGIHAAALDEARWPAAIASIAECCKAATGLLYEFDVAKWESRVIGTYRMSPDFMADYRNHYAALDPWSRRSMMSEVGRATCTPELIADDDLRRTEFYQDYLRHYDDLFYGLGGVIERTPQRIAIVGVQRSHRTGMFDADCIAVVERIMPHLRHSYRVRHALNQARALHADLSETLHALPSPVLVLDGDARIQFANRAAERLLALGDGLRLRGRRVAAANRDQEAMFADAVTRAAAARASVETMPGSCLLSRPRSGQLLSLTFAPLRIEIDGRIGRFVAVLIDPGPALAQPFDRLCAAFRLSSAEAALLRDLSAGKRLAQVAEERRVSVNTLRVHLGRLFHKTGTHRQAELVRFALTAGNAGRGDHDP